MDTIKASMRHPDYQELAYNLYLVAMDFLPNIGRCQIESYSRLNAALAIAEQAFKDLPAKPAQRQYIQLTTQPRMIPHAHQDESPAGSQNPACHPAGD